MPKKTSLTVEQKEYIKAHYKEKTVQEIIMHIGSTKSIIVKYANQQGLRKYRRDLHKNGHTETTFIPPKHPQYPDYTPGQRIKIPTQSGDKSWTRITRGATVLEVYKNKRRVLLAIDGQCPGVKLRYDVSYFDLATNRAVVI